MRSATLALAALALVSACTVRPPGETGGDGSGSDAGPFARRDAQFPDGGSDDGGGCYSPIDLVFVLDVSTSMTEEFAHLRDGIASIYAAADALTSDHTFGLVVFVDDVLVVNGCAPFDSAGALQGEFDRWRAFCSTNGNPGGAPGGNADCPENSLDALFYAATQCTWRDGATHIVIHVTDDTFLEPPDTFSGGPFGGGVPAFHAYVDVVSELVARQVRVGAFAQAVPMECGAGTSADTGQGFFTPYRGMPALPDATSGRVWDIADVRAGTLDMATAINEMIAGEHCAPY